MEPLITTYTGRKVNPLNLQPEDIDIIDIAHHLALLNRFVGATKRPISIAQHSVYVSRLLKETVWEKEGLFHDAPEAYLGDISKWVKQSPEMAEYRIAEAKAWIAICTALKLCIVLHPAVENADRLMVRYENLREGHKNHHMFSIPGYPPPTKAEIELIGKWKPWSWRIAEIGFLDYARFLGYDV